MSLLSPNSSASTPTTSDSNIFPSQGFTEPFPISSHPGTSTVSSPSYVPSPSFSTILPAARTDPFNTLPLELSDESKMLLDHCESKAFELFLLCTPAAGIADFSLTIIPTNSHHQPYSAAKKCEYTTRPWTVSFCDLRSCIDAWRYLPSCQQLDATRWSEDFRRAYLLSPQNRSDSDHQRKISR
jgi:hypothetical protein